MLLKRKGFKLDVSSSGALAASLDKCVVRPWSVNAFYPSLTTNLGSLCAGIQYPCPYHGNAVHAFCRVFLLWECFQRYVWTLRPREPDIHAFHESNQALCRYVGTDSPLFTSMTVHDHTQTFSRIVNSPLPSHTPRCTPRSTPNPTSSASWT